MKKFLVILASVIVAALTLSLTTSCKKDIDLSKSLIGTSWTASYAGDVYTLTVTSQFDCSMKVNPGHVNERRYSGTFILAGGKSSLAGETIAISGTDWDVDWGSGKFDSETELVLNNVVFRKNLL